MKKCFWAFICAFVISTNLFAAQQIPFTVYGDDDFRPLGNGYPKSPVEVPTVYIEDYVLTFMEGHPDYTLYMKDEDGYVVYTNTVWSTDTEVTLPSTLSGDYEIELVMGNWLFTGWIEL